MTLQPPITFVVGPTATGKTQLALSLAKQHNADLLSADSRQVYNGLEITSGVDLPDQFEQSSENVDSPTYFTDGKTRLYGVSFLQPDQEWSIAHFRDLAEKVYHVTVQRSKQLIVVGGSGLYLQSLFLDRQMLNIKPSATLRKQLEEKTVTQLQEQLLVQLPLAAEILNQSDWNNPRRLIRWIEKTAVQKSNDTKPSVFGQPEDHHWLGLHLEKEILEERIAKRVKSRVRNGAIHEVERLLAQHSLHQLPSFSTLGVKDIAAYLNDQITKKQLLELWSRHELQYAKRQITWFKKRAYINWIDPTQSVHIDTE